MYIPSGEITYWSRSGLPDNLTILNSDDDTSCVYLGSNWRTPSMEQWQELVDNCTWTWTEINEVKGCKVQSKVNGYEDKWIFLPAAGEYSNYRVLGNGNMGHYWSSSLDTTKPYCAMYCNMFNGGPNLTGNLGYRYLGGSIRPIYDE